MEGPTFWELARQALSSTRRGYDLLAPKFEFTEYATPIEQIEAALDRAETVLPTGTNAVGADIACGTGRGARVLRNYCSQVVGYDFSAPMLEQASRLASPTEGFEWCREDLATLELSSDTFDRIVTFGAWGHILPSMRPRLLGQILAALRPGGAFVTITADDPSVFSKRFWYILFFDLAIIVRNLLWWDEFHMYYSLNSTEKLVQLLRTAPKSFDLQVEKFTDRDDSPLTLVILSRKQIDPENRDETTDQTTLE